MSLKTIVTISAVSAILIGCSTAPSAPTRVSQSQLAYYDTNGRLIYRGGPLYDSNGRQISPAAPQPYGQGPAATIRQPTAPSLPILQTPPSQNPVLQTRPITTPVTTPSNATLQPIRPQTVQIPQPQQLSVNNTFDSSLTQSNTTPPKVPSAPSGNGRFDANGNLIPRDLDIPTPKFDSNGNITVDADGTNYSRENISSEIQTAALDIPQPQFPQTQPTRPAPQSALPKPTAPQPISGDPRTTAGFDLGGSSWVVSEIDNRRMGSDMTLYFVPIGSQSLAIIDGPCGQQRGVYEGGRGGGVSISGIAGCVKDNKLSTIFNRAKRFTVSADQKKLNILDENGIKLAALTAL